MKANDPELIARLQAKKEAERHEYWKRRDFAAALTKRGLKLRERTKRLQCETCNTFDGPFENIPGRGLVHRNCPGPTIEPPKLDPIGNPLKNEPVLATPDTARDRDLMISLLIAMLNKEKDGIVLIKKKEKPQP